jgi:hypothetical protein
VSTTNAVLPCAICRRPTLHLVQKPNHILHLLLSVVTMGLWLVVWLMVAVNARDQAEVCTVCGGVDPTAVAQPQQSTPARRPTAAAVGFGRALGRLFGSLTRSR